MAEENKNDPTQIGGGQDVGDNDPAKIGEGKEIAEGTGAKPPDTGEGDAKLKEFMVKKGFKSHDELIDFANKIERKVTELSTTSRLANYAPTPPPTFQRPEPKPVEIEIPEDISDLTDDRDKLKRFSVALVEKAKSAAKEEFQNEQDLRDSLRIREEAAVLIKQDPEKFERLKPVMRDLYKQFPGAPIRELYDEADRLVENNKRAALEEIKKELGLDGINLSDLRNLANKANTAPITDSGGATGAGAESGTIKSPEKMTLAEKKELILESVFGESASVLRDGEK